MAWCIPLPAVPQGRQSDGRRAARRRSARARVQEEPIRPVKRKHRVAIPRRLVPTRGRRLTGLDRLAHETRTDGLFIDLLKRFTEAGRNTSHTPTSPTYAPAAFAKEAESKKYKLRKADFEAAMRRLFESGKIYV